MDCHEGPGPPLLPNFSFAMVAARGCIYFGMKYSIVVT
jgi:hypothetical protein